MKINFDRITEAVVGDIPESLYFDIGRNAHTKVIREVSKEVKMPIILNVDSYGLPIFDVIYAEIKKES